MRAVALSSLRLTRGAVTADASRTGWCSTTCSPRWSMAAGTSASPPSGVRIARSGAEWAKRGVGAEVLKAALAAYDRMIGLDLDDISVDGSITKSFCGGDLSGRSPVDRGKQGTRRSVATDGSGIPLALVAAGANRHDSPLFEPTMRQIPDMIGPLPEQPCVHPDRGYDSTGTRAACSTSSVTASSAAAPRNAARSPSAAGSA